MKFGDSKPHQTASHNDTLIDSLCHIFLVDFLEHFFVNFTKFIPHYLLLNTNNFEWDRRPSPVILFYQPYQKNLSFHRSSFYLHLYKLYLEPPSWLLWVITQCMCLSPFTSWFPTEGLKVGFVDPPLNSVKPKRYNDKKRCYYWIYQYVSQLYPIQWISNEIQLPNVTFN